LIDYEAALNTLADERPVSILNVYSLKDYGWVLLNPMRFPPSCPGQRRRVRQSC
jgi:hypothetical protein